MDTVESGRGGQDRLQIRAVDAVRRSETLPVLRSYCVPADELSVAAVPEDQRRYFAPVRGELLRQSELVEEAGSIGRECYGRPHLAQLRGLLVDVDRDPVTPQRDRESQSADAGADDGDPALLRRTHDSPGL